MMVLANELGLSWESVWLANKGLRELESRSSSPAKQHRTASQTLQVKNGDKNLL